MSHNLSSRQQQLVAEYDLSVCLDAMGAASRDKIDDPDWVARKLEHMLRDCRHAYGFLHKALADHDWTAQECAAFTDHFQSRLERADDAAQRMLEKLTDQWGWFCAPVFQAAADAYALELLTHTTAAFQRRMLPRLETLSAEGKTAADCAAIRERAQEKPAAPKKKAHTLTP